MPNPTRRYYALTKMSGRLMANINSEIAGAGEPVRESLDKQQGSDHVCPLVSRPGVKFDLDCPAE